VLDWQRDVLPVLRATYDLMDEHQDDFLQGDDLMARLVTEDRDPDALYRIFTQIKRGGYADVEFAGAMTVAFVQPTEKGLQVTRGWPVPGQGDVEALVRLVDQRIASPDTPEDERTRLESLRAAVGNVSQTVLSSILSAWLSQMTGIGPE
jgi:hypothetical protein